MADAHLIAAVGAETGPMLAARAEAAALVESIDAELADLDVKRAEGEIRPLAYSRAKEVWDRPCGAAKATLEAYGESPAAQPLPVLTRAEWDDDGSASKRAVIAQLGLRISIAPNPPGASAKIFQPSRVILESWDSPLSDRLLYGDGSAVAHCLAMPLAVWGGAVPQSRVEGDDFSFMSGWRRPAARGADVRVSAGSVRSRSGGRGG